MRAVETSKIRIRCTTCTPCQTTDKELEELSLYSRIDPFQTTCETCEKCVGYTADEYDLRELAMEPIDRYKDCEECSICTDCKNGLGLESPPGLRGHSMVMGKEGILIFGGTIWSETNYTVSDTLNKQKEVFTDICRLAIDQINIEKAAEDS